MNRKQRHALLNLLLNLIVWSILAFPAWLFICQVTCALFISLAVPDACYGPAFYGYCLFQEKFAPDQNLRWMNAM